jgi:hypothetical protein
VLSLFKHLLPGKQYEGYFNVFLGMLIVYIFVEPWSDAGTLQEVMEQGILYFSDMEADFYSEEELEAFSYRITASEYEQILRNQIAVEAAAAGLELADVQVLVEQNSKEDYGVIQEIILVCEDGTDEEQEFQEFLNRLSEMLGIEQEQMSIVGG